MASRRPRPRRSRSRSPTASTSNAPTPPPHDRRTDHRRRRSCTDTWLPRKRRQVRATTAYRYAWFVEHYITPGHRRRPAAPPARRSPRRPLRPARHHRRPTRRRARTQDGPRGPHDRPRRARPRRRNAELVDRNVAHAAHAPTRPTPAAPIARSWTAAELATFLDAARPPSPLPRPAPRRPHRHASRRGRRTQVVPTSTPTATPAVDPTHPADASAGNPSSSASRPAPADAASTSTPAHDRPCCDRWRRRLQRDGLPHGIDDWMFCNTDRPLPQPRIAQPAVRPHRAAQPTLPRIRFHDLRHTHASLLVASGVPIKVVSERLGHAHPAFTMHTYQHLLPGMSAAAADQFATLDRHRQPVDVYRLDRREQPRSAASRLDEPVDVAGDAPPTTTKAQVV